MKSGGNSRTRRSHLVSPPVASFRHFSLSTYAHMMHLHHAHTHPIYALLVHLAGVSFLYFFCFSPPALNSSPIIQFSDERSWLPISPFFPTSLFSFFLLAQIHWRLGPARISPSSTMTCALVFSGEIIRRPRPLLRLRRRTRHPSPARI